MKLRTVSYKSVFEGVLRLAGMDPRGDAPGTDNGLTVSQHINTRLDNSWFVWEWPEWTITEERAFRQVWNEDHQFYVVNSEGVADEVFYAPNVDTHSLEGAGYFRVKEGAPGNPPIGTLPTDANFWEAFTPDRYIDYDQVCRRRIGEVLEVYSANPDVVKPTPTLLHEPSRNGILVHDAGGLLTVFIKYLIPQEEFTIFPYIDNKTYQRGDLAYVASVGECFQAIRDGALGYDPVTEVAYWRQCLFPATLAEYVKLGAVADLLRESDTSEERDPVMLQLRGQQAALYDSQADQEINSQINRLQAQGQHYQYLPFGAVVSRQKCGCLGSTPGYVLQGGGPDYGPVAPTGNGSTTITDQCESAWGYLPPIPIPPPPKTVYEYFDTIISVLGPEPSLKSIPTLSRNINSIGKIVIVVGGSRQEQEYQLRPGQADPTDPGQVPPNDWDLATNNKHWERIS